MTSNISANIDTKNPILESISEQNIILGQTRMRDAAGYTGTIVYIGSVASAKDSSIIYAGVIWDDYTRGIHDGSVIDRISKQVVRHFQAPYPTAGSFVKLSILDIGRPWTPAMTVRERYVELESAEREAPGNVFPYHTACTSSGRNDKPIEFLGELKIRSQQQVEDLRAISLRRSGLNSIDTSLDWSNLVHVQELDLAGNLLSDWNPIIDLLKLLPSLIKLSVAGNRIGDIYHDIEDALSHKLIHLNLNETNIRKIETLLLIGKAFPNLEELVLANNKDNIDSNIYQKFSTSLNTTMADETQNNIINNQANLEVLAENLRISFPNLVFLDCSNCSSEKLLMNTDDKSSSTLNNIDQTNHNCCLFHPDHIFAIWSRLPSLQSLSLDDNPITRFFIQPNAISDDVCYPKVQHFQLEGTWLKEWSDLDVLNKYLPMLNSLRLRNCPLLKQKDGQSNSDTVNRCLIIARLPMLQKLNGSIVTEMEQREAARWCIRTTLRRKQRLELVSSDTNLNRIKSLSRNDNDEDDFEHPQYEYWVSKYPELASRGVGLTAGGCSGIDSILADSMLNVALKSMAAGSCTMEPLLRRFPSQLTIGRLKALCARQFGLDVDLQNLQYIVVQGNGKKDEGFPTSMDQGDESTLAYYGIPVDGAVILMHEIDLKANTAEKAREQKQFLENLNRQEQDILDFKRKQQVQSGGANA